MLLQPSASKSSRTYSDHESVNEAIAYFLTTFEERLKKSHRNERTIQYDVEELMRYVDSLTDLAVLTLDDRLGAYIPHDVDWTKGRIYQFLQKGRK